MYGRYLSSSPVAFQFFRKAVCIVCGYNKMPFRRLHHAQPRGLCAALFVICILWQPWFNQNTFFISFLLASLFRLCSGLPAKCYLKQTGMSRCFNNRQFCCLYRPCLYAQDSTNTRRIGVLPYHQLRLLVWNYHLCGCWRYNQTKEAGATRTSNVKLKFTPHGANK